MTLEIAMAQRDAAYEALSSLLVVLRRIGGYMPPTDQNAIREAQALLVEQGR